MITLMGLRRLLLPTTAVLLVLTASPAMSQTPMSDPLDSRDARRMDQMEKVVRELRAIVFQGRDTGKPVVVQPAETDFQMQDLTRRVGDLEQTLTRLNGQLESTAHDLDQAHRDTAALQAQNKALSDRLAALEQKINPEPQQPPPDAGATAGGPPPPAAPTSAEAFAHARQLMLNGDYQGAEDAWRDFTARYGDSPKTPEARYWLGKTLSVRNAYNDAAAAYIGAIRGYPQTSWAPDAMVELSRSLVALKRPSDACQALGELAKRYPKTTAYTKGRAAAVSAQAKCS
jgi:tol-pal system protein YbgF